MYSSRNDRFRCGFDILDPPPEMHVPVPVFSTQSCGGCHLSLFCLSGIGFPVWKCPHCGVRKIFHPRVGWQRLSDRCTDRCTIAGAVC